MIGFRLNNYEIVSILGEGGMGTVYLARHAFMGRKIAVKLLRPELTRDQALVTRFMNEARATNAIGHPNIIDIIDVGMLPDGCTPYLMMELLQGEPLAKRLQREQRLPIRVAVEIAAQSAAALAAAHACDIVHRDLKPDNVFLVPDQALLPLRLRVKVLDFGIAKLRGDMSDGLVKTRTGAIMGTPQYMSPEQCRGLTQGVDHRTDVYALGCMLYEMVCGAPPFLSEGLGDMIMMHIERAPASPRSKNADVSQELEAIILRSLAKKPDDRFNTMVEFERALRPMDPQTAPTVRQAPAQAACPASAGADPLQGAAVEDTLAVARTEAAQDTRPASEMGPTVSPEGGSWLRGPRTTFTSMAGQVLEDRGVLRRRRRTLWLGGVLGATVTMGTILFMMSPSHKISGVSSAPVPMMAPARPVAPASPALPVDLHPVMAPVAAPAPLPQAPLVAAAAQEPALSKSKIQGRKGAKKTSIDAPPVPVPLPPTLPQAAAPKPTDKELNPGDKW